MNSRHTNDEQHVNNISEDNVCKGKSTTKNINFDSLANVPFNERATVLSSAWQAATEPIASSTLLHNLHRITLLYILQEEWSKLDSSTKDELRSKVESCSTALESVGNQGGSRRLRYLLEVSHEPWKHPVLKEVMEGRTPSKDDVEQWCKDEGVAGGLERLRQLCVAGSACVGAALRMARALLTLEHTHGARKTALDTMLVLLFKKGDTTTCISEIKALDSKEVISVIGRLSVKDKTSGRLWKHAHDTALLCAQVTIAGCLVKPLQEGELSVLSGQLASLYTQHPDRLAPVLRKLLQPADSALHIYTVCRAVQHQFADTMRPFVCELYIRALTTAMNELERQKLQDENSDAVKTTSHTLARWFVNLADYLASNKSVSAECILTAFSLHPSKQYYNRVQECSQWMCKNSNDRKDTDDGKNSSEAGVKEATDGIVKLGLDGETAKQSGVETESSVVKTIPLFSDGIGVDGKGLAQRLVSGEVLDAEGLGLTADACNDLAVLLSGPRLKMLTWELSWEDLSGHCLSYMEDTAEGTKAVTKELKFVRLDYSQFEYHEPEVHDIYFGIEKGYEHHLEIEEDDEEEDYWENEGPQRRYRRDSMESDASQSDSRTSSKKSTKQKKKPTKVTDTEPETSKVKKESKKEKKKPDQNTKIKCKVKKKKDEGVDGNKPKRSMDSGTPVNIKVKPFDPSAMKLSYPPPNKPVIRSLDLSNVDDMKVLLNATKKPQPSSSSFKSKSVLDRITAAQPTTSARNYSGPTTQRMNMPSQDPQSYLTNRSSASNTPCALNKPSTSTRDPGSSVSLYRQQMDRYEAWKNMQFEKEFQNFITVKSEPLEDVKPKKVDNKYDFQATLSDFIGTQTKSSSSQSVVKEEENLVTSSVNYGQPVWENKTNKTGDSSKFETFLKFNALALREKRALEAAAEEKSRRDFAERIKLQAAAEEKSKQEIAERIKLQAAAEEKIKQEIAERIKLQTAAEEKIKQEIAERIKQLAAEKKKQQATERRKQQAAERRKQQAAEKKKRQDSERENLRAAEKAALEFVQKRQLSTSLFQDALDEITTALLPSFDQIKHQNIPAAGQKTNTTSVIIKNEQAANVVPLNIPSYMPTDLSPNRSISSVPSFSNSSVLSSPKTITKPTKILDFSQSKVMEYEYVSPLKIAPDVLRSTSDRRNTTTISHPSKVTAGSSSMHSAKRNVKVENLSEFSQNMFSYYNANSLTSNESCYALNPSQNVSNLSMVSPKKTSPYKVPSGDGRFSYKKAEELPAVNIKISNPYGIQIPHDIPPNAAKTSIKKEESHSSDVDNPYDVLKILPQVSIHKMTKDASGSVSVEKEPYVHPSVNIPPASDTPKQNISPRHALLAKDMMADLKQKEVLINNAISVLKNKTTASNSSFQMFLNEMQTMVNAGLDNTNKSSNQQASAVKPDERLTNLYNYHTEPVQSYKQQLLAKETSANKAKTHKDNLVRLLSADVPKIDIKKETAPQTYARKNYSSQMKKQSLSVPVQSSTPTGQVSSSDNSVILRMPQVGATSNSPNMMTQKNNQTDANVAGTSSQLKVSPDVAGSRNRLEMLKNPIKISTAALSENVNISKLLVPSPNTPRNLKDPMKAPSAKRKASPKSTPKPAKNQTQNIGNKPSDTWTPLEWGLRHVKNLDVTNIAQPSQQTPLPSFSTFSTKNDGTSRMCNIIPMTFSNNNMYSASIDNKAQIQVLISQPNILVNNPVPVTTVVLGSLPNTYKTDTIVSGSNRNDSTNHISSSNSVNTNSSNSVNINNLLQYRKPKTLSESKLPVQSVIPSQQSKPVQPPLEQRNDYKDFSDILDVIQQDLQASHSGTTQIIDKPVDSSVAKGIVDVPTISISDKQMNDESWKSVERLFEAIDNFDWQPNASQNKIVTNSSTAMDKCTDINSSSHKRDSARQTSSQNTGNSTLDNKDSDSVISPMKEADVSNEILNDMLQNTKSSVCNDLPQLPDNILNDLNLCDVLESNLKVQPSPSECCATELNENKSIKDENRLTAHSADNSVIKSSVVNAYDQCAALSDVTPDDLNITTNVVSSVSESLLNSENCNVDESRNQSMTMNKQSVEAEKLPAFEIKSEHICEKSKHLSCITVNASSTVDGYIQLGDVNVESVSPDDMALKTADEAVLKTSPNPVSETSDDVALKTSDIITPETSNDALSKTSDDALKISDGVTLKTSDSVTLKTFDGVAPDTCNDAISNTPDDATSKIPDDATSETSDDVVSKIPDDATSTNVGNVTVKTPDHAISEIVNEAVSKSSEDKSEIEIYDNSVSKPSDDVLCENSEDVATPDILSNTVQEEAACPKVAVGVQDSEDIDKNLDTSLTVKQNPQNVPSDDVPYDNLLSMSENSADMNNPDDLSSDNVFKTDSVILNKDTVVCSNESVIVEPKYVISSTAEILPNSEDVAEISDQSNVEEITPKENDKNFTDSDKISEEYPIIDLTEPTVEISSTSTMLKNSVNILRKSKIVSSVAMLLPNTPTVSQKPGNIFTMPVIPTSAVKETVPALNKAAPAVNNTAPALKKTVPAVKKTVPAVNKAMPVMKKIPPKTTTVVTTSGGVSKTVTVRQVPPSTVPSTVLNIAKFVSLVPQPTLLKIPVTEVHLQSKELQKGPKKEVDDVIDLLSSDDEENVTKAPVVSTRSQKPIPQPPSFIAMIDIPQNLGKRSGKNSNFKGRRKKNKGDPYMVIAQGIGPTKVSAITNADLEKLKMSCNVGLLNNDFSGFENVSKENEKCKPLKAASKSVGKRKSCDIESTLHDIQNFSFQCKDTEKPSVETPPPNKRRRSNPGTQKSKSDKTDVALKTPLKRKSKLDVNSNKQDVAPTTPIEEKITEIICLSEESEKEDDSCIDEVSEKKEIDDPKTDTTPSADENLVVKSVEKTAADISNEQNSVDEPVKNVERESSCELNVPDDIQDSTGDITNDDPASKQKDKIISSEAFEYIEIDDDSEAECNTSNTSMVSINETGTQTGEASFENINSKPAKYLKDDNADEIKESCTEASDVIMDIKVEDDDSKDPSDLIVTSSPNSTVTEIASTTSVPSVTSNVDKTPYVLNNDLGNTKSPIEENMDIENHTDVQLPVNDTIEAVNTGLLAIIELNASKHTSQNAIEEKSAEPQVPDADQNATEEKSAEPQVPDASQSATEEKFAEPQVQDASQNPTEEKSAEPQVPDASQNATEEKSAEPQVPDASQNATEEKSAEPQVQDADQNATEEKSAEPQVPDASQNATEGKCAEPQVPDASQNITKEKAAEPQVQDSSQNATEEKSTELVEDSAISNRSDTGEVDPGVEEVIVQNDIVIPILPTNDHDEIESEPAVKHPVVDKIASQIAEKIGRKYSKPVVRLERLVSPLMTNKNTIPNNSTETKDVLDPGIPEQTTSEIVMEDHSGIPEQSTSEIVMEDNSVVENVSGPGIPEQSTSEIVMEDNSVVENVSDPGIPEQSTSEIIMEDNSIVENVSGPGIPEQSTSEIVMEDNSVIENVLDISVDHPSKYLDTPNDVKMDYEDLNSAEGETMNESSQIAEKCTDDIDPTAGSCEVTDSEEIVDAAKLETSPEDSSNIVSELSCPMSSKSSINLSENKLDFANGDELQPADVVEDLNPEIASTEEKFDADIEGMDQNVSVRNTNESTAGDIEGSTIEETDSLVSAEVTKETSDLNLPDVGSECKSSKKSESVEEIEQFDSVEMIGEDLQNLNTEVVEKTIDPPSSDARSNDLEADSESVKEQIVEISSQRDSETKGDEVSTNNLGIEELSPAVVDVKTISEDSKDVVLEKVTDVAENNAADKNFHNISLSQSSQEHELACTIGKVCDMESVAEPEPGISIIGSDFEKKPYDDDEISKLIIKVESNDDVVDDDVSPKQLDPEENFHKIDNKENFLAKNPVVGQSIVVDFNKFEEMMNPDDCNVSDHSTDESLEYISFGDEKDKSPKKDLDSSGESGYRIMLKNPVKTYVNSRLHKRKVPSSKDPKVSKSKVGKINLPVTTAKENTTLVNDNVYDSLTVKDVMKMSNMEHENLNSVEDFSNEDMEIASIEGASDDVKAFLSDFNTLEQMSDSNDSNDPRDSFYSPIFTDDDNILNKVMEEDEFIVNNLDIEELKHRSEIRNRKLLTIERRKNNISKYDREGFGFRSDRDDSSDLLNGRHEGPAALSDFPNPRLPKTLHVNNSQSQGDNNGNSHEVKVKEFVTKQANLENYYNSSAAMVRKRVGQIVRDCNVTPLSQENLIMQLKELLQTKESTPATKVYKNKGRFQRDYVKNTLSRVPGMSDLDHIRIPPPNLLINVVQVGQLPVSSAQQIILPTTPTRSNSTNEYLEVTSNNSSEYRARSNDEQSGSQDNDSQVIKEVSSEESTPPEQPNQNQDDNSIVECPAVTEANDSTVSNESQKVATSESQQPRTVLQVSSAQETITLNPTTSTSNSTPVSNSTLDGQVQLIFAPQSMIQQNFIASDNQEHKEMDNNTESNVTNIIQGTASTATTNFNPVSRAQTLVNILSQKIIRPPVSGVNTSQVQMATFPKGTPINALSLQQALAQILPPPLSQASGDGSQSVGHPTGPQVVHIVQGKAAGQPGGSFSGLLMDNSQQSVVSVSGGTQVLHIVQGKNTMAGSNATVLGQSQLSGTTFGGLSLVDAGSQHGGNQVLHIVNTGAQSKNSAATAQLLKRVNLLTSLTNAQGNEQKMVQFVCKSADGKSIQLNAQPQRGMVLRLQPIETPTSISQQKPVENLVTTANTTIIQQVPKKSPTSGDQSQEIKSRSIYEENYAKFIQNSKLSPISTEKSSTTLPKFNQAFGKSIYQESVTKNDSETNQNQTVASEQPQELTNTIGITQMGQLSSPPLLIRKTQQPGTAQSIVGQMKQGVTPMNIQTMHGGVIYTRQIPVNIGGGQTINLITVPSTELIDEAHLQAIQKQVHEKNSEQQQSQQMEQQVIKLVPQQDQNQQNVTLHVDTSSDDANQSFADQQQSNINTHPLLAQMRIKVPMLTKGGTQMVTGTRVVRPVLQIQRNIIPGTNPQVYQQLVLTTAPALRPPTPAPAVRPPRPPTATPQQESNLSSSTLEQLREFDMVLEQVKERSTVQPGSNSNSTFSESSPRQNIDSEVSVVQTSQPVVTQTPQREVLYSIGPNHTVNVTYVNKNVLSGNPTVLTSYPQNQETTTIVNMGQQNSPQIQIGHGLINSLNSSKPTTPTKVSSKTMKPKSSKPPSVTPSSSKASPVAPKTSVQKPLEDEQTTQRILYILAEYKEQVENSPDKDKPAPRRRSNPPTNPSTSSKRKKGSGSSSKKGSNGQSLQEMSPLGDDTGHTMGSEDSSCGLSQGECAENSIPGPESQSPQGSPQKAARKLVFPQEQEVSNPPVTQPQRNVIIADGQTIAMTRPGPGGKATAVLMPANYLLPMSMVKGGQQITIVTNQGPKILNVPQGEGGATNTLFLQRLISPAGLKPMLARPGQVRQVRLPANAVQNLQGFNLTAAQNIAGNQEGSWLSSQQVINNQQPKLVVEYSPNVNVNHDLNPDSVKSEASDAHSLKEENMSVSGGSEIATPRHSEASSDELSSKNRSSDEGIFSGQTDSATDDSVQSTLHSRNDQILHHIQVTKAPTNATVNLIQVHSLNPNEPGKIYSVQNPASLGSLIRLAGKTSLGQTFQTINVQGVNQDLTKVSPDVQECAQNLLLVRKHFDGQYTLTTSNAADSGLRDVEMKNTNLNQLQQDMQVDASPSPGSQQSYGLGHSDQLDDNLAKVEGDGTVSWSLSSNGGRSVVHSGGDDASPGYVYSADSPSGLVQQAERAEVSLRESDHDRRVLRHEYSPDGGSPAPTTPRHLYHKMFISSPDKGDHAVQDHLKKDDHSQSSTITLHSSNSPSFTIHHHHGSHQLASGGPSSSGSGGSNTHHHNHHQSGTSSSSGQHSSGQSHHHPARLGGDARTPHHVLRHKYALMEHELRLQKSLSEECEDLGVDSPSASDLFPEADLLFANSPSSQFDHSQDGQMSSVVAGNPNTTGSTSNMNNSGSVSSLSALHGGAVSVTALGLREENLGPVEEEFARMHPNTTFHSGEIDILEDQDDLTTFRGTSKRSTIRTISGRRNEVVRSVIEGVGSSGMPTIYQPNKLTTHFSLVGIPKRNSINVMSLQSSDDNSEGADDSMNSAESKDGLVNNKHLDGMLNSNITRDVNLSTSDSPGCISSNIIQRNVAQVIRHASDEQVLSGKDGGKLCGDENSPGPQNGRSFLLENSSDVRQGDSMILKTLMMERDGRDGLTCSSPEQHSELFWESNSNSNQSDEPMTHGGTNLLDFSSEDSNKCCKSPPSCEETNSTDSSSMGGMHLSSDKPLRLNSVIKSSGSTSTAADGPILHSALTSSIPAAVQDSRKLDLNLHKSDSNTSTSPDAEAMDMSARRSWGRGLKSSGVRRVLSPRSLSTEINMGAEIETSSSEGVNVLTKNVTAVIHSGSSTPEDSAVVGRRASLRGSNHTKRSCHCCPPPSPPIHSANTSTSSVSGQTTTSSVGHGNATGTSGLGSTTTPSRGRNRRRPHLT